MSENSRTVARRSVATPFWRWWPGLASTAAAMTAMILAFSADADAQQPAPARTPALQARATQAEVAGPALKVVHEEAVADQPGDEPQKHAKPTPVQNAKNIISSPFDPNHKKFQRGANPIPRRVLATMPRFQGKVASAPMITMLPPQLSFWDNSKYGDCVSASSAFSLAAYSVFCGQPEVFVTQAAVVSWAGQYGYLNGADLPTVASTMQQVGMTASNGTVYKSGPYSSVDFTTDAGLQAALQTGPVNLGIDADALPSGAGNNPAWYAFGGNPGQFSNEDHCVRIAGYGPTASLFAALNTVYGGNAQPPAGAPATAYLLFTWSTIGVVDLAWINSTAGEAGISSPTIVGMTPGPTPGPAPTPTLTPTGTVTFQLSAALPAGTYEIGPVGLYAGLQQTAVDLNAVLSLYGKHPRVGPASPGPVTPAVERRISDLEQNQLEILNILKEMKQSLKK